MAEYNPKLRKKRGVYYTPEPIVKFIVRSVDDILQTDFRIETGLADTSKINVKVTEVSEDNKIVTFDKEIHKVQILDPAVGTGTFLAEVVRQIHGKFKYQEGVWSNYVEEHLIPRLNGFEILMAPYTMCHLKLEMLLRESKYRPRDENNQKRLRVYLTNSLEKPHEIIELALFPWLSNESKEANKIKKYTPVMVVIGNPPYSGESKNKDEWIMKLMDDYKKEPGGKEKLKEKNSKWINDDYVKFIRYGQYFIEKNGEGILAFINPHGFLDNPTFRGMRWNLLKTYDKIYTIDLHGNSNKKETAPDGSKDENVFDIQQGVSINFFIKTGKKQDNELGNVFYFNLYGERRLKYDFLLENSFKTVSYKELINISPNYFFVSQDYKELKFYNNGFSVSNLFEINGTGIISKRDDLAFQYTKNEIIEKVKDISELSCEEIKKKYNEISWESRDGKVEFCKSNVMKFGLKDNLFVQCSYRPFDKKWTYYTGESKGFIGWPVKKVMQHFLKGENVGLVTAKSNKSETCDHFFISKNIMETKCGERTTQSAIFPLYLYLGNDNQRNFKNTIIRKPNLNFEIIKQIADKLNLLFTPEKETLKNTFAPIDVLDYIYAILYSPAYRKKYKKFLKSDFPRIPYPDNTDIFWKLVELGSKLRQIHLLESQVVSRFITRYCIEGNNLVENVKYDQGKVYINESQYFDGVPEIAWNFYIGGYRPAHYWLKSRVNKKLNTDDIFHYQKIIVALVETDRMMKEIDDIVSFE